MTTSKKKEREKKEKKEKKNRDIIMRCRDAPYRPGMHLILVRTSISFVDFRAHSSATFSFPIWTYRLFIVIFSSLSLSLSDLIGR